MNWSSSIVWNPSMNVKGTQQHKTEIRTDIQTDIAWFPPIYFVSLQVSGGWLKGCEVLLITKTILSFQEKDHLCMGTGLISKYTKLFPKKIPEIYLMDRQCCRARSHLYFKQLHVLNRKLIYRVANFFFKAHHNVTLLFILKLELAPRQSL